MLKSKSQTYKAGCIVVMWLTILKELKNYRAMFFALWASTILACLNIVIVVMTPLSQINICFIKK